MTRRVNTVAALGAVLLTAAVFAQQPQQKSPEAKSQRGQMSMDNMMKNCREHCQATSQTIDRTMSMMDEAKQSNDPAKMRGALEQVQQPMAEMREHMSMCMRMMDNMHKMHGGRMGGMMRGGRMGGMMGQQDQSKAATSPEELDPVCQMKVDPKTAPKATYKGKTYYFCSESDKAEFEKNPDKYLKKSPQ